MTFVHLRLVLSAVFAVALVILVAFTAGCSNQTMRSNNIKIENDWPTSSQKEIMAAQSETDEYVKAVKTAFQVEDIDRVWSAQAVDEIKRTFMSKEAAEASIVDIQCRSVRCRIVVDGDPVLVDKVLHRSSPELSEMFSQSFMTQGKSDEDGIRTVIFLIRHGHSFNL